MFRHSGNYERAKSGIRFLTLFCFASVTGASTFLSFS